MAPLIKVCSGIPFRIQGEESFSFPENPPFLLITSNKTRYLSPQLDDAQANIKLKAVMLASNYIVVFSSHLYAPSFPLSNQLASVKNILGHRESHDTFLHRKVHHDFPDNLNAYNVFLVVTSNLFLIESGYYIYVMCICINQMKNGNEFSL